MKPSILIRTCAAVLLAGSTLSVTAQEYPTKPIRWMLTLAPGGSSDVVARVMGTKMASELGQPLIVDHRAGAGGLLGGAAVASAAPDGYTLIFSSFGPNVSAPLLSAKPPYQPTDFAHVVLIGYAPLALMAHPSMPVKTLAELLKYMKDNPGKVNWGSSGVGASQHIALALFEEAAGVQATHVPYKGAAPALTALAAGEVQMMHSTTVSARGHLDAGRLRIIAIAAPRRATVLPNVPTLQEGGVSNADAVAWFAISAPKNTPVAIISKLNAAANKSLADPEVRKRLQDLGLEVIGGPPSELEKLVASEVDNIRKLIQRGVLKPDS